MGLLAISLGTPGHRQQTPGQISGANVSKWIIRILESTGRLHRLVMLVSVYTVQCPHVLQKIAGKPRAPHIALWRRALSTSDTLLHANIHIQGEKEEKRKFCPYRKGIADRDGERVHFSPLSAFSFIRSVLYSIEENSWVFRSSFKSFNHWLPRAGSNKHGCVLSIFVCRTTSGNRPAHRGSGGKGGKLTP